MLSVLGGRNLSHEPVGGAARRRDFPRALVLAPDDKHGGVAVR